MPHQEGTNVRFYIRRAMVLLWQMRPAVLDFGGLGLRSTPIARFYKDGFAVANEAQQFWSSGVWGFDSLPSGNQNVRLCRRSNGFAMANEAEQFCTAGVLDSDSPSFRKPQYPVLHKRSNCFAMAHGAREFCTSGAWASDSPPLGKP